MIVSSLMNLVYWLMDKLLFFEISPLPEQVTEYIETAFDYIVMGAGVAANYVPLEYLLTLFGIVVSVEVAVMIYHLVMWILKKIPFLSME